MRKSGIIHLPRRQALKAYIGKSTSETGRLTCKEAFKVGRGKPIGNGKALFIGLG
jgi:hypothetical protein